MDAHPPRREDDLSDVERRLAGWRPAPGGPDADAMLFAAGLAAGRRGRGRVLWPAACALLAVLAAGLGGWGASERAGRVALAGRPPGPAPAPDAPPATAVAVAPPESSYTPSPDDYYHLRRRAEQDLGRWLDSPPTAVAPGAPPPAPAILRAGQRDSLPVQ